MTQTTDVEGNLTDGCGIEHDPATNLGCEERAVLDYTPVIVQDMVEGVLRYRGIAAENAEHATKCREAAANAEEGVVEYEGKAAALSEILVRLGYEPPA